VFEILAEKELQRVTAAIPGAIYRYRLSLDGTSGLTFLSPGVEALTGVPRDLAETDVAAFEARIHPDDRQRVAATILQSAKSQTAWSCDFRVVLPEEKARWLRSTAVPELPAADGTLHWNGILTDITHEKRIEQELTRVHNEWRATVDAVGAMIVLEDSHGRVARCNRAVPDYLQLGFPEILGGDLTRLFFGPEAPTPHGVFRQPSPAIRFPGSVRWHEVASYRLDTFGWVHVISDVTERRAIEEKAQRFTAAIDQAVELVIMLGPTGRIEYVNPAFCRELGKDPREAFGRTPRELQLSPPDDPKVWREIRRTLAAGAGWQGRYVLRREGSTVHAEISVYPVRDASGVVCNYVVVGRDVTEREHLEAVASAINMMDQVGFAFSAIRHELGNPVNSIKTALSVLREQIDVYPRETVIDYLDRTLAEIGRVEYLLKVFKTFNLFEHPRIEPVAIDRFLRDFLGLLRDDLGQRGILGTLQAAGGLGEVLIDPRALNQALLNLVTNAVDAVEQSTAPRILLTVQRRGRRILLQVEDNGHGMGPEQLTKLFHPFFTTKPQGNGLGLAIVKKLVTKMGGTVDVVSARGVGTTVTLSLVAGEEEA
jgi:PAS domain S-box-containing protein